MLITRSRNRKQREPVEYLKYHKIMIIIVIKTKNIIIIYFIVFVCLKTAGSSPNKPEILGLFVWKITKQNITFNGLFLLLSLRTL